MEIKNMNGFCELNENTMMEIDGGARRVAAGPVGTVDAATAKQVYGYTIVLATAPFAAAASCFTASAAVVAAVCSGVGWTGTIGGALYSVAR